MVRLMPALSFTETDEYEVKLTPALLVAMAFRVSQRSLGGMLSCIVTLKEQEAELLAKSVAVQLTSVEPRSQRPASMWQC